MLQADKVFPIQSSIKDKTINTQAEKNIELYQIKTDAKHSHSIYIYESFYKEFGEALNEIPSSNCKTICSELLSQKMICLGIDSKSPGKNSITGTVLINKSKIAGVVLDVSEFDARLDTKESPLFPNITEMVYAAYFHFIRGSVIINKKNIKDDSKILSMVSSYLESLFMSLIGSKIVLTQKQKQSMLLVIKYFVVRFSLGLDHALAVERALSSSEYEHEFLDKFKNFKNYSKFTNITKAFYDFGVVYVDPSSLVLSLLKRVGAHIFFSVTSSIDYLLAAIILAVYKTSFYKTGLVNSQLQSQIEKYVYDNYLRKTKFDGKSLDKVVF